MADYRLSRPQQNEIHALAVQINLDPADFEWQVIDGPARHHKIVHLPTGGYCNLRVNVTMAVFFVVESWPTNGINSRISSTPTEWGPLRSRIVEWLDLLKAHHEAPDLFALAQQQRAWLSNTPAAGENTAFSKAEREVIKAAIGTIADEIRKLRPTADRLATARGPTEIPRRRGRSAGPL